MSTNPAQNLRKVNLPAIAAVAVNAREVHILSTDGEIQKLSHAQAKTVLHGQPALVCHAPYTRGRLDDAQFYAFDVLELFAFVHPGRFAVPTAHGISEAIGIAPPENFEDYPFALFDIAKALLEDIQRDPYEAKANALEIAKVMGFNGKGWPWTPYICEALGESYSEHEITNSRQAMNVWKHLPEWAEDPPEPPPSHHGVTGEEARQQLKRLLGHGAEDRQQQMEYTGQITAAFNPAQDDQDPHVVLAEAGTGVGKTLGYLAPASVWADKNKGSVWVSTFTKNLQRQIDQELDKLYPDPDLKDTHVAVRKGRENYLCLLNLEETVAGVATARNAYHAIAAGIMTRWAAGSKDGDLTGADFPGWLSGLLGYANTVGLSDRRGECIYSACDHYSKCFVEHSIRKSKRARVVVANHALVMIQSALSSPGEDIPSRYVFDEGHHLFGAADSAYAAHLTARETKDLRRWLLGNEGGRRGRARGIKKRAEDLCAGDAEAEKLLDDIVHAANCLTADSWTRRLKDGTPKGPTEEFLHLVYKQVYARAPHRDGPYSLETEAQPVEQDVLEKAIALKKALKDLKKPMTGLADLFLKKLAQDDGYLDSDSRKRLDAVASSLERRALMSLGAWINMLDTLKSETTPPEFVDWMEIERVDGNAIDVGLYRHHVDPMKPFAASIKPHLHGMAITSATLRDNEEEDSLETALTRTGAPYISKKLNYAHFESPFDYAAQTKIFIINDVRKDDLGQVAGAYRTLFEASGGGGLGLFTAISRLRAVHNKIAMPLEEHGLHLYSQHVDDIDPGTLVDMFRDDTHACLLGTDAIRDGVDVPGESLRLIVFDRVPWPRPTILHKARREAFGGRKYDEMLTRLKLKQAFGRLIRRAGDKGVFVMLDPMLPSRIQNAFPKAVEIEKIGLSETAAKIKEFLRD
ncbi:MAG: ATP-dependent DNA helicase [Pseudomonadota bacterium]